MTNEMIKKLCGDILIYIERSTESLPDSTALNIKAIKETIVLIYEEPESALEWSESLYKMIDGLYESTKHFKKFVCYDENGLFTARGIASRLYDDVREMRP